MVKYKTKDNADVVIPNVGITKGGFIETDIKIESPILELVNEAAPVAAPETPVTQVATPQVITITTPETKEQI